MGDENTIVRFGADFVPFLVPGETYFGVWHSSDSEAGRIDVYPNGSQQFGVPISSLAFERINVDLGGSASHPHYGMPIDGIFCSVTIGENRTCYLTVFGIQFAWFEPFSDPPELRWVLKSRNGVSKAYLCLANEGEGCAPFMTPFGVVQCKNDPPIYSHSEAIFVSGVGAAVDFEGYFRMEYQAAASDDPNLDNTPGIRSAWNYLAANACSGATDEDGNGDGDPGEPNNDGPCESIAINCPAKVIQCPGAFGGGTRKVWCWTNENCKTQTGNRCMCSGRFDITNTQIPDAGTQVVGTVIFMRCAAPPGDSFGGGGNVVAGRCDSPFFSNCVGV